MNIQAIAKGAHLRVRSEKLIAEIHMRILARKVAFAVVAVVAALMGLGFVNWAAFVALESVLGPVWTPAVIGLANFILAALALLAARQVEPGPELAMAHDMRKLASDALEAELAASLPAAQWPGLLGEPHLVRLLLPAIVSIIGALRRRSDRGKDRETVD
jgi:hypothetical protein